VGINNKKAWVFYHPGRLPHNTVGLYTTRRRYPQQIRLIYKLIHNPTYRTPHRLLWLDLASQGIITWYRHLGKPQEGEEVVEGEHIFYQVF
jgi:hypothetical protein